MRLKEYVIREKELIFGFIGCMIVVNLIFFASLKVESTFSELLYMDLLCLLVFSLCLSWHYYKVAKVYRYFDELMKKGRKLEWAVGKSMNLAEVQLLDKAMHYEKAYYEKEKAAYKESLNNLMDYTTQIVHDIKVNLAVCEMISKRLPYEEREKLSYEIEQMKFRVTQMLYVTRANHYNEDIRAEYFNTQDIVRKAIKENAEFFMSKNIELDVQVSSYEILSDQKWILYILSQILNNSSKYTAKGGLVKIEGHEDEKAYYLRITDNGVGIVKEELGRIFDKGYTGSNGRLNTKATGMGLYYAKRMADVLNIELQVESERNEYTAFQLAFYKHSDYISIQESHTV